MKLGPREAAGYFAKPDPDRTGLLIYGADAMRVALKRQQVIAALVGPDGEEEMRLSRLQSGDLRKDPAMLMDAVKAIGFFPGPRVVFVEDANDAIAEIIAAVVNEWSKGDSQLVITAGALKASSKLRKIFETHRNSYAAGIYDDPPSRQDIENVLSQAGIQAPSAEIMAQLNALARELQPGDFRQTMDKIALYKIGDTSTLSREDILACAPTSTEADLDDVLNIVAEARVGEIDPVMSKLRSQGVSAVGLCIGAMRHFRLLHAAASDPGGPGAGLARARPPVFGPRRDRLARQAQNWGVNRLETALTLLTDTDLALRSAGQTAPAFALVERALIRLAMLGNAK